jgi:glutamine amidotransferase-like uncharacterized protein
MKPTIAIFIHDPQCETECALGMIDGLVRDFDIRTFGIDNFNIEFLRTVDAVCFPGGMGDADDFWDIFTEDHIDALHTFIGVYNGKYLGICMGAYWAGPNYFDIAVDLEIGQYIERPTANIDYDGPTVAEIDWGNYTTMMYFYDGCAILGDNMDVIATYANGDPMAVIQGNIGMIGCHPEALDWWYEEGNMNNLYDPKHAQLMSNFLKDLVNNE